MAIIIKKTIQEVKETYQQLSKFNITRLIESAYNNGTTLPSEILENIDFNETSKKHFSISRTGTTYGNSRYNVDETLAVNVLSHLPLEAYKNYIDISWLNSDSMSDYGIASSALNDGKYDFLHYMLDYSHNYFMAHTKDKSEETRNLFNAYQRTFLKNIFNISNNVYNINSVNGSANDIAQYFDLFKSALPKFNHFYHMLYNRQFTNEQPFKEMVNETNWFKNYHTIRTVFSFSYNEGEFFAETIQNSKAFVIFESIFKQFNSYDELPLPKQNILQIAFDYGNKKLLKHMCAYSDITESDLNTAFQKSINKWQDEQSSKFNNSRDSYKTLGQYSEYLKNIFDMMHAYYPDYQPHEYSALSSVLCVNNDKFVQKIIERFPALKTERLYGLTVDQSHYAKKILEEFLQLHDLTMIKENKDIDCPNYKIHYLNKIVERMGPYNPLTDEDKAHVHGHIAQYFLEDVKSKFNEQTLKSMFLAFTLDKTLSNDAVHVPKMKI